MVRCKVCQSSFRKYYDDLRSKGESIPDIFNETRKIGESFSEQSLYRHFQNHYNQHQLRVIPSDITSDVSFSIFRPYLLVKDQAQVQAFVDKLVPLWKKYLNRPYWNSETELYEALKNIAAELSEYMTLEEFESLWKQAIIEPVNCPPLNGKSFHEYCNRFCDSS